MNCVQSQSHDQLTLFTVFDLPDVAINDELIWLDKPSRRKLLTLLGVEFVVRRVKGCHAKSALIRFDKIAAESQKAIEQLAEVGRQTGGAKATTAANCWRYLSERGAHDAALYSASVGQAEQRQRTYNNRQRSKAMQRNRAAIVRAIHDARIALGILPPDAPMPCSTKHDDDVLLLVGRVTFGHQRGHRSTPAKAFVKALARQFLVVEVSEYMTSQLCDVCHGRLVKTRAHSVRHWRCEHRGRPPDNVRGRFDGREINKDVSAAFNMFVIGVTLVVLGERPTAFCSPAVVAFNSAFVSTSSSSSSSARGTHSKRARSATVVVEATEEGIDADGEERATKSSRRT